MPVVHPVKPWMHDHKPALRAMSKKKGALLVEMGKRISQLRVELSAREGRSRLLTQEDIADRLGVAQSTVGRWEAGLKEPGLERIKQMAELFGVTPEYIAFGASATRAAEQRDRPPGAANEGRGA